MDKIKVIFVPILKLLDTGLYLGDIVSDIYTTFILYTSCLYEYFWCSISFLVSSYLATLLCLKLFVLHKETYIHALIYPMVAFKIILRNSDGSGLPEPENPTGFW